MDKQVETSDHHPKKRGFFDRPASFDFWMSVGGRFWGGLLVGLGFGLFTGAMLIKDELIPLSSMFWVIAWLALFFIGLNIALRSVNRSAKPGTDRSETS
jgi:hypothetical protein